ncbi:fatty acid-2 hydroxylase [Ramaria rubella]|nr:fatty acid-2 hydroxylase [Ramaria rubella]
MVSTKSKTSQRLRLKLYTIEDVHQHQKPDDCWVVRNGYVYNISAFLPDHPGGDDIILEWAGKDVGDVMKNGEHSHSDAAIDMMSGFSIGRIGADAGVVADDWVATEDFHPDDTDVAADFEKCEFLDLRRPLLRQVWEGNFSKSFYLSQIHQPRHVSESARLFGPEYLEMFTRTAWYVVPMLWLPIATFLFLLSALQFSHPAPYARSSFPYTAPPSFSLDSLLNVSSTTFVKSGICFLVGNVIWTILEYTLHRFLFHVDEALPDKPAFLVLHFLTHGVHHYLPMDRLRLVMPPPLFFVLSFPFTRLAYILFPTAIANGIISGSFTFYVLYDCMHYALHHTKLPAYLREQKKYHLAHHYKNFELGFGVTSKIWDIVFGTVLPV